MQQSHKHPAVDDRRLEDRAPLPRQVQLSFAPRPLAGPGQNISSDGVLFVAEGVIEVSVLIEGEQTARQGVLVRAQSLGDGKLAMAIKFPAAS